MSEVVPSSEARTRLPSLMDELAANPDDIVVIGRQRRREVVMLSAHRYDEIVAREQALGDLAWAVFATERTRNPTSAPVSWEDALRRRAARERDQDG